MSSRSRGRACPARMCIESGCLREGCGPDMSGPYHILLHIHLLASRRELGYGGQGRGGGAPGGRG